MFALHLQKIHTFEGIFSPGMLFSKRTLWPLDRAANTRGVHEDMEFFEKNPAIVFLDLARGLSNFVPSLRPGKLAHSVEGAGKRRIFAIGNYVKQRLLYPVHKSCS